MTNLICILLLQLVTSVTALNGISGHKEISEMNLLLPASLCSTEINQQECHTSRHELYAYNGCYTWQITHPQLIEMKPGKVTGDCVDSVILRPLINRQSKTLIQIIARDKSSGQVLETQATIGLIDRLAININYRHLSINDKKHIDVVAYDDQGSIFSGLDGFLFDWSIISGQDNLRLISRPEGYVHKRSAQGTDLAFVKGIKPGSSEVKVKILEQGYENINSVQVTILVVDPFVIAPNYEIHLAPTSKLQYSLLRLKKQDSGEVLREQIKCPNSQYKWTIKDEADAKINQDGSFISGLKEGTHTILVTDQNMENNTAEVQVQVVFPYRLEMSIYDVSKVQAIDKQATLAETYGIDATQPSESRILIEDRTYLILLSLFDKNGNRIMLTENFIMENINLLDQKHIQKLQVNKIGSEILFKTRSIDVALEKMQTYYSLKQIKSMSDGQIYDLENNARLSVDAELILTKPVQIIHPTNLILLPYLEQKGQIWSCGAVGGSGVYTWSIAHPEIVSIEGSVTIMSLKVGKTILTLQDLRNPQNIASIDVEVAQISQLKWLEEQMELKSGNQQSSIGEVETMNLIAFDRQGRKFTNCTSADLKYTSSGEGNIVTLNANYQTSYDALKSYLNTESIQSLLILKQKFDENPTKIYTNEVPQQTEMKKAIYMHNNFGICGQLEVSAGVEGLARVRATIQSKILDIKVIESEFAEVAVYKVLQTVAPDVQTPFADLYSKSQISQEFTNFDQFYENGVVSLIYGTEATWSVSGGTNFWKDYSDKYNVEWQVTPREGISSIANCLSITREQEEITKFNIRIRCSASTDLKSLNKLTVLMRQNSKQSRHLMRPAQHQISLLLQCGAPNSARLLWSQSQNEVQKMLPNSRILASERIHFALVNSQQYVKTILLDTNLKAFFNTSSIISIVQPNDTSIAQIIIPDPKFESAIESNIYAKRIVQFQDKIGQVVFTTTSSAYLNSLLGITSGSSLFYKSKIDTSEWSQGQMTDLPKDIIDILKIQVVRNVQVEPKSKSLYVGSLNKFRLNIHEGSGYFAVTLNDIEIAEMVHKEREIIITPKKQGMLEIRIEDVEIPGSEPAIAQILVSDIEKLFLWAPSTLMEQGDNMNLIVSAFDSQGNDFDVDQYTNMRFSIETEMTGVIRRNGLKTESTDINTEFKAIGYEPGIFQLTAFTRRVQQTLGLSLNIVSDMIRVEVFPLLEIFPNTLLITPNMKYTLQIVGGPQTSVQSFQNGSSIEINFDIQESQIAAVDQNREVTGYLVGDATLRYQIIQQRTQRVYTPRGVKQNENVESRVVSKKNIPIRVRLVTDIEIPLTNQRQIYAGSLVKFNAVLKFNQEYFNQGIALISYSWNSTSGRILNLELPSESLLTSNGFYQKSRKIRNNKKNDENALFTTTFNSSSIYATAGKEGDAQVQVLLAIEYPQIYNKDKNWFTIASNLKVAQQLEIQINSFSTPSTKGTHMYLIPPNTVGYIQTNIETKLKLGYSTVSVYDHSTNSYRNEESSSPIVKLVDNKAIQTFEKYGKVTVIVEQGGQQFSDQVAMLNVFISDIYSMQVMDTYDGLNLPLGSSLKMPIHFQNEHANRFANNVEGIKIDFSISHPKVVSVYIDELSQTLTIKSQGSGECNILIYLVNRPQIFDVVKVRVSSIVRPLSPVYLHLGGEVNFRVINPDDQSKDDIVGNWKSSEPALLQIQSSNGRATGLGEGRAEVMLSNHINAASIVHVGRIAFGQIEQKNALVLNTDEKLIQGNRFVAPDDLRVRIKLYLTKNGEEVMPTTQFDGVTLIRQNVGIHCTSDYPDFVVAVGEVSDLEGFFCILKYKQDANHISMPRFVKISVNAYALLPGSTTPIYSDQIAIFDVQLISSIKVEKKFKDGITLSKSHRSESIQIFSSSDFSVQIEYLTELHDDQPYLIQKVSRQDSNSNDYNLTVIVPTEVNTDFKANIILTHPYTKFQRILPVKYQLEIVQKPVQTQRKKEPEYEGWKEEQKNQGKWTHYAAIILVMVASILFILHNWTGLNVFSLFGNRGNDRLQRPSKNRPMEMNNNIRQPARGYPMKPQNVSNFTDQSSHYFDRRQRDIPAQNLDNFRAQQSSGVDQSRVSVSRYSQENSKIF